MTQRLSALHSTSAPRATHSPGLVSIACAAFVACLLAPYLTTGFLGDDSINSVLPSYLKGRGMSLPAFVYEQIAHWVVDNGRIFPVALSTSYFWWGLCQDLTAYRVVQVGLVALNVWTWVRLLEVFGAPRALALLSALIAVTGFQLRDYHDPITSYSFLLQITFGLGAASVLMLRQFQLDPTRSGRLFASLALFAGALLTYEPALAFFPVLAFLAWQERVTARAWLARYGHTLVLGAFLASTLALRFITPLHYNGTQSAIRPRLLYTFFNQATGALPWMYAAFGRSGFFVPQGLLDATLGSGWFFALWALTGSTVYLVLGSLAARPVLDRPARDRLTMLGLTLWLVPAALVSLSGKYQDQIHRPGLAYLPVYLSCFGMSAVVARVLDGGFGRPARARAIRAGALGLVAAVACVCNWMAAGALAPPWKTSRVIVERAMRSGLLAPLAEDSVIIPPRLQTDWFREDFIHLHSGRRPKIVTPQQAQAIPCSRVFALVVDQVDVTARLERPAPPACQP